MPAAKDETVGYVPLVAQQAPEAISRSTKKARKATETRGVRFASRSSAAAFRRVEENGGFLKASVKQNVDSPARSLAPLLADIPAEDHITLVASSARSDGRGAGLARAAGRGLGDRAAREERADHLALAPT